MRYRLPFFFYAAPAPLLRLVSYILLCLILMLADRNIGAVVWIRSGLGNITHTAQKLLASPYYPIQSAWNEWLSYLKIRSHYKEMAEKILEANTYRQENTLLKQENNSLRALLGLQAELNYQGIGASIVSETDSPIVHRAILNTGKKQGVTEGAPVINKEGVLGQVTRTFDYFSEVTLLTDNDHAIPVLIVRNGLRAVAYGGIDGWHLKLRFLSNDADVIVGDQLSTSGIDGLYPASLPIGVIQSITRNTKTHFSEIIVLPLAKTKQSQHVLVLPSKPSPKPELVAK